jgi:hypothetical protein
VNEEVDLIAQMKLQIKVWPIWAARQLLSCPCSYVLATGVMQELKEQLAAAKGEQIAPRPLLEVGAVRVLDICRLFVVFPSGGPRTVSTTGQRVHCTRGSCFRQKGQQAAAASVLFSGSLPSWLAFLCCSSGQRGGIGRCWRGRSEAASVELAEGRILLPLLQAAAESGSIFRIRRQRPARCVRLRSVRLS